MTTRTKSPPRRWYVVQRESDSLFLRRTKDPEVDRWVATPDEASIMTQLSHARAMIIRRVAQGPMKIRTLNYLPDGARPARRKTSSEQPSESATDHPTSAVAARKMDKLTKAFHPSRTQPVAPMVAQQVPSKVDGMVTLGSLLEHLEEEA